MYIPKLLLKYLLRLVGYPVLGFLLNFVLFFWGARVIWSGCEVVALSCLPSLLKTIVLLGLFPILYLLVGQMAGVVVVSKELLRRHEDQVFKIIRPFVQAVVSQLNDKMSSGKSGEQIAKAAAVVAKQKNKVPWLLRVVFKTWYVIMGKSVVESLRNLKSTETTEQMIRQIANEVIDGNASRMRLFLVILVSLNLGFFVYIFYAN